MSADTVDLSILHPTARDRRSPGDPGPAPPDRPRAPVPVLFLAGIGLLIVSVAASIMIGTSEVSVTDLGRVFGTRLGLPVEPLPGLRDSLIWDLRVPRVLLAALVGAGLALCGTVLQAVTRNALADPYLLGISSGASTGVVAIVVLGLGSGAFSVTGGAFAGALHRVLLPFTALAGAIFLVWTDALARVSFAPQEVPVGVFTALLGVPLFLLVLRKRGEL
ncbi:hypothetical protein E1295_10385 [Nonomuraea mesophila]|uniref:Iron ABC transporter permease n=1 Tax=Nonomuraea mesophila TaxID=2530382 RepID=A0A4R5FU66_9ACTN|nr:iron chelate uptake ABC transporter family permease subunit [Nonomuraea mesophila]TDE56562.1 hypothetical protein E1295_10385 [Nonomuraea mesophila]